MLTIRRYSVRSCCMLSAISPAARGPFARKACFRRCMCFVVGSVVQAESEVAAAAIQRHVVQVLQATIFCFGLDIP